MNNSNIYFKYYYEIHTDLVLNGMPVHEADIHAVNLTEERIGSHTLIQPIKTGEKCMN